MIHAADYRAKAADCARRAEEAQDDYHRKNFQALAAMWTEMAEKAEGRVGTVPADASEADVLSETDAVSEADAIDDALETIRNARTN